MQHTDSTPADLVRVKLLSAVLSLVLAVFGCWLARVLERGRSPSAQGHNPQNMIVVFGNALAAGILLSASLVHMLPSAVETFADISSFPIATSIAGATFVFLIVLGEVAITFMTEGDASQTEADCSTREHSHAHSPGGYPEPYLSSLPSGIHDCSQRAIDPRKRQPFQSSTPAQQGRLACPRPCGAVCYQAASGDCGQEFTRSRSIARASPAFRLGLRPVRELGHRRRDRLQAWFRDVTRHTRRSRSGLQSDKGSEQILPNLLDTSSRSSSGKLDLLKDPLLSASCCSLEACPENGLEDGLSSYDVGMPAWRKCRSEDSVSSTETTRPPSLKTREISHASHDSHLSPLPGTGHMAQIKSFMLFAALGFHSVTEGLGLGSAQNSGILLSVMIAVLAHKGLAAFALGSALMQSDMSNLQFWIFVGIFSAGSPVGCVIGSLCTSVGGEDSHSLTSGLCIAIASGTFLQVSSVELLPRTLADERYKTLACVGFSVGFSAMTGLAVWV